MRKLLVFLLLLGAGLFLLYWLDRRSREALPVEPEPARPPEQAADTETQGFRPGGPSLLTLFDEETKLLLYRARSEDTHTEGAFEILTGVTFELFDPTTEGLLEVRLLAERARVKRTAGEGLEPVWERRLELEGVRAQVLEGSPFAPLAFETAAATVDVTDARARKVQSAELFTVRAPELSLSGRGLEWNLDQSELVIQHAGDAELLRPGTLAARLRASEDGTLRVTRSEGPDGSLTLEAKNGAELEPGAENPGKLSADELTLRARRGTVPGEPLAIESLDAHGNVDWTSGKAHFQGQRLTASFLPSGRLERARLDGEPRAELALVLSGGVLPEVDEPAQRLVVLEGQDALDIVWREDGYEIQAERRPAAPGAPPPERVPSVVTRDFRLESAATLKGWLSEDQRSARFEAGGGVLVTSGEATLETANFKVEIKPDEQGETVLLGTASGGARLEGKLPREAGDTGPARAFTLTSPDGLQIERSSRGWRVVESTRVEVSLEGSEGFRARADRISDFVVPQSGTGQFAREGMHFNAHGAIAVELEDGRFGGEELEVLSVAPVPRFVVRGTPESKAFFSSAAGSASALEVERTGNTWHARGEVSGSFDTQGSDSREALHTTFAGDELTVDFLESPELMPGETLRTLRALVVGHVQCSVSSAGETLVVRAERFSAEHRDRLVAGAEEPEELGSLFIAEGTVHADLLSEENELGVDCERLEVERTGRDVARGFRQMVASGDVHFDGRIGAREARDISGECEVLVFDSERHGSMEPRPHGRVTLQGLDPEGKRPFRMTAERVDFELVEAAPDHPEMLRMLAQRPELRMLGLRARAEHFTADDQSGVVLSGGVRLSGATSSNVPFTLDAAEVVLVGRRVPEAEDVDLEDQLDALLANGGVDFRLSDGLRARGERLSVRRATGLLRLEGSPASFDMGAARLETEWVEFDPVLQILVATGPGRMLSGPVVPGRSAAQESGDSWSVSFLSASTLLELDSVILVIQEPIFHTAQFESALRATWAILWLNRDAFQDATKRDEMLAKLEHAFEQLEAMPEGASPLDKLAIFRSGELSGLLREVYFEGPVEVLAEGELVARADAIYLDVASQHGWLARATVNLGSQFLGQRQERLTVKTDWLRLSSDGSLRADRATVTGCNFDDPHVSVITGDLQIEPIDQPGKARYNLRLKDNRVELYDWLRIPLPTIEFAADEELQPILPTLSLANSARFGTLFGFAFTRPADNVGELFDSIARPDGEGDEPAAPDAPPKKPRSKVDAHYKIDGSYLGSRGGLLDLGLEIEAKKDYWFDLYLGLVLDSGEDKGFVRVDEDDRSTFRSWIRSQAYFDHGKSAWSFSLSDQSDAGVQAEFFEGQFVRYERAENYLQWRRSAGENFAQASAKVRLDDFRTDVEELPSLSGYRGRSPLFSLGDLSVLHTGDARAEYLRRREGTEPHSPFGLPSSFDDVDTGDPLTPDGLGEREVLRADTTQALELPVPLGASWKLTPFVSARATAWSEGVDEHDSPTRLLAEGGARLGASFWKRAGHLLHQIAPFVEYRAELEREDEDGAPVVYDSFDRLLSGDFLRFGARGRFWSGPQDSILDLDLVAGYAGDRSDQRPDGWLPVEIFGRLVLEPYGHEFEIFHDSRHDLETRRTVYSLVSMGTHFGEEWGAQFSHQRGLDADAQPLFEAASVSGLYRWTEKWEFEARESFSLLEDQELDTKLVLRRYGHDIVFEMDTSVREGEGSSFGVSVKPRFGYRPPRVGYVPW